jgi:hypothetical protein
VINRLRDRSTILHPGERPAVLVRLAAGLTNPAEIGNAREEVP